MGTENLPRLAKRTDVFLSRGSVSSERIAFAVVESRGAHCLLVRYRCKSHGTAKRGRDGKFRSDNILVSVDNGVAESFLYDGHTGNYSL